MKYVSPEYQKAIQLHRTQGIRNQMHAKISFGVLDQYAFGDAAFTVSPGVSFSDPSGIQTGVNDITESYASWEQNFWQLTGKQRFLNDANPYDTGYISSAVSNGAGIFLSNPYIDVSFSTLHSMVGITLQFDTVTGTAPIDFTITAYENGAVKNTWSVTGNTNVIYQGELGIEDADRIRIEFIKARPYNRIRINSMLFGIAYSFSDEDIISITHNRAASPVSTELPAESLSFTLFNEDGRYNIDSSFSLITFLQKEQLVTIQYGYDVDGSGNIEWLSPSTYWLQSWQTDGVNATFTCKDIFNKLNSTTYKKGVMDSKTHSLRDLAIDTFSDAGITDYWADDWGLQNSSSYLPLQYDSHASNLQLIANLGRSSLEQSPEGGVIFRYREQIEPSAMGVFTFGAPQVPYSYYVSGKVKQGGVFDTTEAPDYATFEEDFFRLDGSMRFLPQSGSYVNSGYVSDVFPDHNGNYPENPTDTAPVIQLDFTRNITFGKLEIDIGESSGIDQFYIVARRDTTPQGGTTQLTTVMQKYTSGTWENGKLYFKENFDRVVRLFIYCVKNPKNQRGRIKRVKVHYPMNFELTSEDTIGNPKGELLEKCGKVIYDSLNCIVWSGTPTEPVQTVSVSPNVLTELKNSDIYYSQRFECDDPNVVIVEEDHYAYCSFIKITGTDSPAKIKWYAYTFASSYNVPYESEIGDLGEATEFSNPISSDNTARQNTADWMADYLSKRRQYTVETLGYPEVDPGDLILYNGKEATVVEANINFNQGAMRETFILRGEEKLNGVANT